MENICCIYKVKKFAVLNVFKFINVLDTPNMAEHMINCSFLGGV